MKRFILGVVASIGANAMIVYGITIGRYAFIAAGAVVAKDVPDYALIQGVPGRQVAWVSRHGQQDEGNCRRHFQMPGERLVLSGV